MTEEELSKIDFEDQAYRMVEKSMLYDNAVQRFDTRYIGTRWGIMDNWGINNSTNHNLVAGQAIDMANKANATWCRALAAELTKRADELDSPITSEEQRAGAQLREAAEAAIINERR